MASKLDELQITLSQAIALHRVYNRNELYPYADGFPRREPESEQQRRLTFSEFCELVQISSDCIMVPWNGMWLGIEKDGYTHS